MRRIKILIVSIFILNTILIGCTKLNTEEQSITQYKESEKIVVYSLYENPDVREIIECFNNNNEDIEVKYEVGMLDLDEVKENDVIKLINTEIITGNGPDIIIMDRLPSDSYMEKGLLEDLSDIVNINKNSYFSSIYDIYNNNNEIFIFPIAIEIPIIFGENLIENINNMQYLSNSDKGAIDIFYPIEIFKYLFYSSSASWINENGSIDYNKFSEFLIMCREIYFKSTENIDEEVLDLHEEIYELGNKRYNRDEMAEILFINGTSIIDKILNNTNNIIDIYNESNLTFKEDNNITNTYSLGYIRSIKDMELLEGYKSINEKFDYKIWDGQVGKFFVPKTEFGINKYSKNKDAAKEVVKYFLNFSNEDIITPNKDIFRKNILDRYNNESGVLDSFSFVNSKNEFIEFDYKILSEHEVDGFINNIENIETKAFMNIGLFDKFSEEIEGAISGEMSIDSVIKTIKNQLDIYMIE